MPAKPTEGVDVHDPMKGESLADYYARTTQHWTTLASASLLADGVVVAVDKELKREAFRLARERFAQLDACLEQVAKLDVNKGEDNDSCTGVRPRFRSHNSQHRL